jgi:hypothetical protein
MSFRQLCDESRPYGRLVFAFLLFCFIALPGGRLAAQVRAETIRGRVASEKGEPVRGAAVLVTRAPDRLQRSARTDSAGGYSVHFAEGTGDYLVHVSAPGWQSFRQRVRRQGGEAALVVDVKLASEVVALTGIRVRARRAKPPRDPEPGIPTGAAERQSDGVAAAIAPGDEGNPAALAAAMPGALRTGDGFSVLGLGAGQNGTTLNGLAFDVSEVPRAAAVRARVSTSTYDPARGGFAGAQVALELAPGSIFTLGRARVTADAAPSGSYAEGSPARRLAFSAGGEGELVENRFFYNGAVQLSRESSGLASIARARPGFLTRAGIDADSVTRFLRILPAADIPLAPADAPDGRTSEQVSLLGRVDHTPDAPRTWGVTTYGSYGRAGGLFATPTATVGFGGESRSASASVQAHHSAYLRNYILNETRTALTVTRDDAEPYLELPGGSVLVTSDGADGLGLGALSFGGRSGLRAGRRGWTWETTSETQWHSWGNAHRLKAYVSSRFDGHGERSAADRLGTFTYPSLADLEANRPSRYTRELGSGDVSARLWSGALALGDLWRASPSLRVLYGVRLEGNRYLDAPPSNGDVLRAFGARTERVPNTVHASPRLGFTWFYGGAPSYGVSASPLGVRNHQAQGVLRGGVGEFRGLLRPGLISGAQGADRGGYLVCTGAGVPVPDWSAYADDAGLVPDRCAGDEGVARAAAPVELFGRGYAPARSWRANLAWSPRVEDWTISLEGIYSLNLDQPSRVDLNLAEGARFTLDDEGGRPVYVAAADVDPATGAPAPAGARRSAAFAHVVERRSDMSSVSRQLVLSVAPDLSLDRAALGFSYALSDSRSRQRGFDGAAAGDPGRVESAPSALDARHQLTLYGGLRSGWLSATVWARAASGLPYTPLVSGDVNGDGQWGDRAYVFDPAAPGVDAATAEGIRSLLGGGGGARRCLAAQLGAMPGRNGCRGSWTQDLSARLVLANPKPSTRGRLRDRATVSIHATNVVAGVDQLVHGAAGLRGWGAASATDPVLYRVRGFDPAGQRYRYEVNSRFGQRVHSAGASPFRLTLDIHFALHPPMARQQLERLLGPGRRGDTRPRLAPAAIRQRYARNVPDLYAAIIAESDSLFLTAEQVTALRAAQAEYRVRVDSVWAGLAAYLAELPDRYSSAEALRRQEEATDRAWEISRQEGPTVKSILSPLQISMLPGLIRTVIHAHDRLRVRVYANP